MTAKTLSPQRISRLLGDAGFKRSEQHGPYSNTAGYRVRSGRDTRIAPDAFVRVRWWADSGYHPAIPGALEDQRRVWLAKYAETIDGAGWAVEVKADCLIVTAPPITTDPEPGE